MATKAGRIELKDIKTGKTFWKASIVDGKRVPEAVVIMGGARLARVKRADGSFTAMWTYEQIGAGPRRKLVCDPMWSPYDAAGHPVFDKLFVNRSAVLRWIKRYETNRITTLCEDRRVFMCGDRPLRTLARTQPDQLNLETLPDHRFQHAEIGFAKHYGVPRIAFLNETPHG